MGNRPTGLCIGRNIRQITLLNRFVHITILKIKSIVDFDKSSINGSRQNIRQLILHKMHLLGVWLIVVFLFSPCTGDCPVSICEWYPWESWGSCSKLCGGGYRSRDRSICCRREHGKVIDVDQCLRECGKDSSGFHDYGACNTICHHGGTFHYNHYDVNSHLWDYGHCICSQKYGGTCCDSRMYIDISIR